MTILIFQIINSSRVFKDNPITVSDIGKAVRHRYLIQVVKKPFKIEVDPTFFVVFIIMLFFDYHYRYLETFAALIIHEAAHIAASVVQGIKLDSLKIFPIGLNAVFLDDFNKDANQFLINISGPFINLLIFLVCFLLNTYYLSESDNMRFFILVNIFLAVFNMLPVLPLDGGRILRDILTSRIGLFKAYKYSRKVSKGLGLFVIILGIIQFYGNIYNFSLIFLGSYIFHFLKYEESEVYFMNIKNLVYKRSRFLRKGIYPGRELVVIKSMRLGDILKDMDFDRFHIIYVLDEDMRLAKVFTEQEIIDNMSRFDAEISFDELMKCLA